MNTDSIFLVSCFLLFGLFLHYLIVFDGPHSSTKQGIVKFLYNRVTATCVNENSFKKEQATLSHICKKMETHKIHKQSPQHQKQNPISLKTTKSTMVIPYIQG
jgi:hypothetical protein